MLEPILSIAITLGILLYLIRYYKVDVQPETFSEGDTAQIGNPYHKDYPEKVQVIEVNKDHCLCRYPDGKERIVKRSDLIKQSF